MFKITALALVMALCNAEKESSSSRLLLQAQGPPVPPVPPAQGTPALPVLQRPTQIQPPQPSRPQQQPAPYNPYQRPSQPAYNPYSPYPQQPQYNAGANCMMMGLDWQDCLMFGGMTGSAPGFGMYGNPGIVGNPGPNYGFPGLAPGYGQGARPGAPNQFNMANCMAWGLDPQDCMFGGMGAFL